MIYILSKTGFLNYYDYITVGKCKSQGLWGKCLSLVSMTLIGNEDFGVTNLFIISRDFIFQLVEVELGSVPANCEQHKY